MMRSDRTANGRETSNGGLLALFPLALVACAIAFLAVGAGRVGSDPASKPTRTAVSEEADASAIEQAAAAVVAISLARVAPALPEEALEPRKPAAKPQDAASESARKAAPKREASAATNAKPREGAPAQARADGPNAPAAPAPEQAAAAKPAPENQGVLARIGSYAPSPSRIVGAVSGGVSKIASYIPGL